MRTRALRRALPALGILLLSACADERPLEPAPQASRAPASPDLAIAVRQLADERGIGAMPRPPHVRGSLVRLGRALAFDPILSGNRDIACMTCHLPGQGTGDGRSLSIGQGASGLGPDRVHPDGIFIPRNAPPLFNLSALESLFWDGRVSADAAGELHTPAGDALSPDMRRVLEFGPASALALFPVLSREEMRGASGNELATIPDDDPRAVWRALMARLGAIPEYRRMFQAAYPGTSFESMTFAHAANAIGGFLVGELTFTRTPWDRFLAGRDRALTPEQLAGARTFLTLRCSQCHTGPAFTDNRFHNVAVAQFGPGTGDGSDGRDDFGRMKVTGREADRYAFRTSPLRNVALTGPFGHDGAFFSLRDFIDHYGDSDLKLRSFREPLEEPLLAGTLRTNFDDVLATRDTLLDGVVLTEEVVDELAAFMTALTDPRARDLGKLVPRRVPSGLPVDGPGGGRR